MIKPLGNKIVVERIVADKTTSSGIILQSTQEPDKAKIIALGSEVNEVVVGDIVLINWNVAKRIEGETYIIPITDVIFVYE